MDDKLSSSLTNPIPPAEEVPASGGKESPVSGKIVHDLRNAIAPISNAVQLLRFHGKANPALAPVTDIIDRQVNQIVRMLNALAGERRPPSGEPNATGAPESAQARSEAVAGPKRILLADDNGDLLISLSGILREAGHEVRTVEDGLSALLLAQSWKPAFVLLDVHMPGMNGFETAKQLRAMFPREVMKLILMTGSSIDETALRGAERAGFDHCIDKVHGFAMLEKLLGAQN